MDNWRHLFMIEPTPFKAEMKALISKYELENSIVHENPYCFGVLNNPWYGMNKAFEQGANFAFVAEEDVIVSDDILEYVEWCRDNTQAPNVLGVCANQRAQAIPEDPNLVWKNHRFCPVGWGTWKLAWYQYLRESWDHNYTSGGRHDSGWDWNINLRVIPKHNQTFIWPAVSRTDHIGELGGQHMLPHDFAASTAPTFEAHRCAGIEFEMRDSR